MTDSDSTHPGRLRRLAANLALAATAIAAGLVVAEVALRLFAPESTGYFVFAPGYVSSGSPLTELMPGVKGEAEFRTNSYGIRGAELGPDGSEYRILALGGSTSQNVYLDQHESWPIMLGDLLGPTLDGRHTWSGSVGRSGATARTNSLQFKYLLPSLPPIDAAVMLLGVNDLAVALRQGWSYQAPPPLSDPEAEHLQMRQAFIRVPGTLRDQFTGYDEGRVPFYKRQSLWHLLRLSRDALVAATGGARQDPFGWTLVDWRGNRAAASVVHDSLPPLEGPLAEYRGYLDSIVGMAEQYGTRLVLITQPVLWRADLSSREKALLWMGGMGDFQNVPGMEYYAPGPLAEAMAAYNDVMLSVCFERAVECVDLAAAVPADTSAFYDDVHPTERGSRLFAETVAAHFARSAPYSSEAPHR